MRILITGIAGFAARHFLNYLNLVEPDSIVAGVYHENYPEFNTIDFPQMSITLHQTDLSDADQIAALIKDFKPDFIMHLAGKSSVAESWLSPAMFIRNNTDYFLNIIEAVRFQKLPCRILSVGSTEEYGHAGKSPLREDDCPHPASPYGVARVLQQQLVEIYAQSYNVDIVHARSFNHIGPFQKAQFVIPSFAKQIVGQFLSGKETIQLTTGDIEVTRDFTDVRDTVRAYHLLLLKGKKSQTYNVCSGTGFRLKDIISMFEEKLGRKITHTINEKYFRPAENKFLVGSYKKLERETGWKPSILIEQSIDDIIAYWKETLTLGTSG